jgi:hypothetical protein
MESVVKYQLLSAFIDKNNILIEQESGFRKSHSCDETCDFQPDFQKNSESSQGSRRTSCVRESQY